MKTLSHLALPLRRVLGESPFQGQAKACAKLTGETMSKVSKMRGIGLASLENLL